MKRIAATTLFFLVFSRPLTAQSLGGCRILPANNVWNTPIDALPADPNSVTLIDTIGAGAGLHPDFSSTG